MKSYKIQIHDDAQEDLERLHLFLAQIDDDLAGRAIAEIEQAYKFLMRMPHSCRRTQIPNSPKHFREMIVNFGKSGYLILFEITSEEDVMVMAVKHQRESDYH
jgi:plasmid stabilization system protein ParE